MGSGGTYRVAPVTRAVPGGLYEDGSLIWRSRWTTEHGVVEAREALVYPAHPDRMILLRRLSTLNEPAALAVTLALRDDYGRASAGPWRREGPDWVTTGEGRFRARWSGGTEAQVTGPADGGLALVVHLNPGEYRDLVLELSTGPLGAPEAAEELWQRTERAWAQAVPDCDGIVGGRDVRRSFAVLRGLTQAGGGTVAAATTSLPERAEAGRNYDYRYCWIRDICYIGHAGAAMVGAEHVLDDAVRFVSARLLDDGPEMRPAYTCDGGTVPPESPLDTPGYPGGHNRIGNRAGSRISARRIRGDPSAPRRRGIAGPSQQ